MNLDATREIEDFSLDVILDLSRRIEKSRTPEQLVCRESELDEVWRLIDFAVDNARSGRPAALELALLLRLRAGVIEAHDLIGVDENVAGAAARMREIARALGGRSVDLPDGR